jgi:hypothetical protein
MGASYSEIEVIPHGDLVAHTGFMVERMDSCWHAQLLRLRPAYLGWLHRTFLVVMVPFLAPALAAFLTLMILPLPALPIPVNSQADASAPPPPSPQPPHTSRPGAEVLGPMRINGSVLPNQNRQAPSTQLAMPAEWRGEPQNPRFLVEDGVIFEPSLEEDVYQRPKVKGMLHWDLEQLRGHH